MQQKLNRNWSCLPNSRQFGNLKREGEGLRQTKKKENLQYDYETDCICYLLTPSYLLSIVTLSVL